MFRKKQTGLFSIENEKKLRHAYCFKKPDTRVFDKLLVELENLSFNSLNLVLEEPLQEKVQQKYYSIHEVITAFTNDLNKDHEETTREFYDEPLLFNYYLVNSFMFNGSVEVVKDIFHSERKDIGHIYSSIVIKHEKGVFYYWGWE